MTKETEMGRPFMPAFEIINYSCNDKGANVTFVVDGEQYRERSVLVPGHIMRGMEYFATNETEVTHHTIRRWLAKYRNVPSTEAMKQIERFLAKE